MLVKGFHKICFILFCVLIVVISVLFYTRSSYVKTITPIKYSRTNHKKSFPIDVVVTYVDSTDKKWLLEKNYYLEKLGFQSIDNPDRWNDNLSVNKIEEIELCLLSILKNLPYIRKIILVTQRPQYPRSLKTNPVLKKSDKIILVHHDMFIPDDILPVFNSNVIESYIHKIPNLSEHFLYFNDDMFVSKKIPRDKLFDDLGVPIVYAHIYLHPVIIPICPKKHGFMCQKQRARNLEKSSKLWSLDHAHMFKAYTKSWYQACLDNFYEELKVSNSFDSKFRSQQEILILQLLLDFGLTNRFAILGDNKDFPNKYLEPFMKKWNKINTKKLLNENVAICINNSGGATRDDNIEKVFVELKNSFM